jgi:spermidine/putrescine transport system permease protein
MMENKRWLFIKAITAMCYLFLLFPLAIVILISFNQSRFPTFPPEGFSLRWYHEFFTSPDMLSAVVNSFIVATGAAIVAGMIGTITAYGFVRRDFAGKSVLATVLLVPLLVGNIVIGIALSAYFVSLGMEQNYLLLIIAHSVLAIPYVFVIVRVQLSGFNESLEEAALTMGANEIETFVEITFPLITPGIAAGMLFSFVVSFGEFTATQFWIDPGTTTAPVQIYSMLRTGITPTINAMATILIFITVVIPLVIDVLTDKDLILKSS